jgi:hypothetical protein
VSPAAATGTVKFYDGSDLMGSAAASEGSASINTSNLSVGHHNIRAEYGGSDLYQSSSGTCSQTVGKADTTTTVTSSANPSVYGDSVTFTATLNPSGATGKVQFKIDGADAGGQVTISGGKQPMWRPVYLLVPIRLRRHIKAMIPIM